MADETYEPDGVLVLEFPPPPPHWRTYGAYLDSSLSSSVPISNALSNLRSNLEPPARGEALKYFVDSPPAPSSGSRPSTTYASIMSGETVPPSAPRTCAEVTEGLKGGRECFLSLIPKASESKANTASLTKLQDHLTKMHASVSELRALDAVKKVKERLEARKRTLEAEISDLTSTMEEIKNVRAKLGKG
mmetsp:Transcript_18252/g.37960  ORF Transcript_18252/g.37960 Transcript_18252/m.37960 type:complete len:190 (+) Transcript_18252:184-753(+)